MHMEGNPCAVQMIPEDVINFLKFILQYILYSCKYFQTYEYLVLKFCKISFKSLSTLAHHSYFNNIFAHNIVMKFVVLYYSSTEIFPIISGNLHFISISICIV
jgi:hypothetical protein